MSSFDDNQITASTLLVLGNFDGLHKGHMKVLKNAKMQAEKLNLMPCVLLFCEHPKKVLLNQSPELITPLAERDRLIEKLGFKIIKIDFLEIKDLSPMDFLLSIYCEFSVRAICTGFNYHYAKGGVAGIETLYHDCIKLGIKLFVSEEMKIDGETVSSTRIRSLLKNGDVDKANELLGRKFSYTLTVIHGAHRGKTFGFPTINQEFDFDMVHLRRGVYASRVMLGGEMYPAVTNIGVAPTVRGSEEKAISETYIIGFNGDLYGEKITVELLEFIRDEKKFDSITELTNEIKLNTYSAQEVYKRKYQFEKQ